MKALRRSMKGEKDNKPQVSIAPKSAVAIVPPKKVIRALYDYTAQSTQELSFSRGDFFHVIGRENDPDWYEACNPALPDARGLVPVGFFQALGRTERDSAQSDSTRSAPSVKMPDHDSGYGDASAQAGAAASAGMPPPSSTAAQAASQRISKSVKSGGMVYGIVMYDFQAERADELEAKAGEAIIVIAQSNPEWFVAKPIGRLGGPGLIPVSFVEIRDMATNKPVPNPQEAVRRAGIPRVEEWKKMATDYKNSSITLGKFETGAAPTPQGQQATSTSSASLDQGMDRMSLQSGPPPAAGRVSQPNGASAYSQQQQPPPQQQQQQQQQQQPPQPLGAGYNAQRTTQQSMPQQTTYNANAGSQLYAPVSARIPRYCFAEEKYWFVIDAVLEDGRRWELSRYYEDFYDFQIALLTEFPAEAGNTGAQKRTLPYMPGPVSYVTDAITEGRLHNLDAYVKNLLAQPPYISRCNLVKQFFAPREGDYPYDPNANPADDDYRLSAGSQPSSTDDPADGPASRQQQQQQQQQQSRNGPNGGPYSSQGLSAAPLGARPGGGGPQNGQASSSLSQASLSPGVGAGAGAAIKVKLNYAGDLVAIRVPSDIMFRDFYDRIRDRLKIPPATQIQLSYKDEPSGDKVAMLSNDDLDVALSRNEKLLMYVEKV